VEKKWSELVKSRQKLFENGGKLVKNNLKVVENGSFG
jgi:hypothetical protein